MAAFPVLCGTVSSVSSLTGGLYARRPLPVAIDMAWIFPVAFVWSTMFAPWFVGLPMYVAALLSACVNTMLAESVLAPLRGGLRRRRELPVDWST